MTICTHERFCSTEIHEQRCSILLDHDMLSLLWFLFWYVSEDYPSQTTCTNWTQKKSLCSSIRLQLTGWMTIRRASVTSPWMCFFEKIVANSIWLSFLVHNLISSNKSKKKRNPFAFQCTIPNVIYLLFFVLFWNPAGCATCAGCLAFFARWPSKACFCSWFPFPFAMNGHLVSKFLLNFKKDIKTNIKLSFL